MDLVHNTAPKAASGADWKNLRHHRATLGWKHDDPEASLREIDEYAEQLVEKAIDWYYRKKKWKARFSRVLRYLAILLTAFAGLLPILTGTWNNTPDWL